ncbi:putative transcription factor p65 homolog [Saccoglossus kowalevskii]
MACRLDDGTQGITERDHTLLYQYQRAPRIEIIIQPKSKILRWRYQSEGNTAGSLVGDNSTPDNITYPTIEIKNYCGPAELVISLVSNDNPPCPHYCSLVGKDCQEDGTCVLRIPAGQQVIRSVLTLLHIYIS